MCGESKAFLIGYDCWVDRFNERTSGDVVSKARDGTCSLLISHYIIEVDILELSQNNKRIAKNTIFLYIRMAFMMLVSLYTSRVVLKTLGVEDFGIYNVVGGIVILFSFINNALITATQRFLNYELGQQDVKRVQKVFSASLTIHIAFAILLLLVSETIGLWFLDRYIVVPESRWNAAFWVYQFAILSACINLVRAPYNAVIIAYEKMSFFAYISIIEAVLKLFVVGVLVLVSFDKLIHYSILTFEVTSVITLCYVIYTIRKFPVRCFMVERDKSLYIKLLSFSGWSLFGSIANVGTSQGISILLNMFFGVIVNAAMGVANQVNVAIYNFVSNFQLAFTPQLVKSYAVGDIRYFINLIIRSSKYSYLLLFFIALPVFICCEELLSVWLTEVPEYAVEFCRLMILFSLLDAIQCPLWISVQAIGKIKNYQILMSILILFNLPLSWIALRMGFPPTSVLMIRVIVNVVTYLIRMFYVKKLFQFPVFKYVKCVIIPCSLLSILSYWVINLFAINFDGWSKILIITMSSVALNSLCAIALCLDKSEKLMLKNLIKSKI